MKIAHAFQGNDGRLYALGEDGVLRWLATASAQARTLDGDWILGGVAFTEWRSVAEMQDVLTGGTSLGGLTTFTLLNGSPQEQRDEHAARMVVDGVIDGLLALGAGQGIATKENDR